MGTCPAFDTLPALSHHPPLLSLQSAPTDKQNRTREAKRLAMSAIVNGLSVAMSTWPGRGAGAAGELLPLQTVGFLSTRNSVTGGAPRGSVEKRELYNLISTVKSVRNVQPY